MSESNDRRKFLALCGEVDSHLEFELDRLRETLSLSQWAGNLIGQMESRREGMRIKRGELEAAK